MHSTFMEKKNFILSESYLLLTEDKFLWVTLNEDY